MMVSFTRRYSWNKILGRSVLQTEPTRGFESFVKSAQKTERELISHDAEYEAALHTGIVSRTLVSRVMRAFIELRCALDELGNEMSRRCSLDTLPTQRRYPIRSLGESRNFASTIERTMPGLVLKHPVLVARISHLHQLAGSDGWLATLASLTDNPEVVQLRRATAYVTLSPASGSAMQLTILGESGQPIPMLAPILLDGTVGEKGGEGQAFYLAIGPTDREAVSLLSRCIRGVEQVATEIREVLPGVDG